MSVLHRSIELLEPYDGKLSCTVLRGGSARKGADLPDPYNFSFTRIIPLKNLNKTPSIPDLFVILQQIRE